MNVGETLAKLANEGEPPLISQLSRALWAVGVAQAAIRLELFTELHGKELTSATVATLLGSNHHYTKLLLNACVSIGLLEKTGDAYRNSKESETYLVKGEPRYYGDLFTYWTGQWPLWDQLDSGVRTGKPLAYEPEFKSQEEEAAYWRHYMMAMHQWGASGQQDLLLQSTDLTGKKKLLDVAGGSGVYTMALCREYPELEAVLFDQEKALPIARSLIETQGLSRQISTVTGDFLTDAFGTEHDVVLISGVLNLESREVCRLVCRKSYESMVSGGLIIIQDDMIMGPYTETTACPALSSLMGAVMYGGEGEAQSGDEMAEHLTEVGFTSPEQIPLSGIFSLVTALKP